MNALITCYPTNDYRNYLVHHGVKGQRWGVRRYQNMDGTLTAAGKKHVYGSGKTGAIERTKIRLEGLKNTASEMLSNAKNAKGIGEKASSLVGYKSFETRAANSSYTQKRLAAASKTKLGKHIHNVRSYNDNAAALAYRTLHGYSTGRKLLEQVVPITKLSTPMKTIAGRKTTHGRELLIGALTSGIGNIGLDVAYRGSKTFRTGNDDDMKHIESNHLKNAQKKSHQEVRAERKSKLKEAKAAYKARDRKIQDEYDKAEKKIESKYKRGQLMSDKDTARELAADDKARKAWADSKARYKAEKKAIKQKYR